MNPHVVLLRTLQVKRLPSGTTRGQECCVILSVPPAIPLGVPQPKARREQPQSSKLQLQLHTQPQPYPQQQPHAGPSSTAGAVLHSHRGSPLHLSADSACSSSSLPGRGSAFKPPTMPQWGENVTLMSKALGWEEWQASLAAGFRWGEHAPG